MLRHVEEFLKEAPEVAGYSRRTGPSWGSSPNRTRAISSCGLKHDRKRSSEEVIDELRDKMKKANPSWNSSSSLLKT
ncbi:MAG: hypothetical protein U0Y68_23825 [Blastocatellia bacterium]